MTEKFILRSLVEHPQLIEAFDKEISPQALTTEGRIVLDEIRTLVSNGAETSDMLLALMRDGNQYRTQLCSMTPSKMALMHLPKLKNDYALREQRRVVDCIAAATRDGMVVDLSSYSIPNPQAEKHVTLQYVIENMKPEVERVDTGVPFLQSCTGGFELGQLILISGDPEAGKTSMGAQILEHIANTEAVTFFIFEFTREMYARKARDRLNNTQLKNIYIVDNDSTLDGVCAQISAFAKLGVRVFLIDSQMRITVSNPRNMEDEESRKFTQLATLARELNLIVMFIIQTSKGDRHNPMGSKKGGHEANIIIRIEFPNNGVAGDNDTKRVVHLLKNKQNGVHAKKNVFFDCKNLRFMNVIYEDNRKKSPTPSYRKQETLSEVTHFSDDMLEPVDMMFFGEE